MEHYHYLAIGVAFLLTMYLLLTHRRHSKNQKAMKDIETLNATIEMQIKRFTHDIALLNEQIEILATENRRLNIRVAALNEDVDRLHKTIKGLTVPASFTYY